MAANFLPSSSEPTGSGASAFKPKFVFPASMAQADHGTSAVVGPADQSRTAPSGGVNKRAAPQAAAATALLPLPDTDSSQVPAAAVAPETADQVVVRLAALKPMDYDRQRKGEAQALGIQIKTLDDLVRMARNEASATDRLPFSEVEPHPEPIDPAQVLDEVTEAILRHVVMDQEKAYAVALWIVMTWFIDEVEVAAILIINAPEKECGKSQLLTVVGYLAARPLPAANSTPSFLFRAITAWRPTLLIDEADTFIRDNDELKGLVNAGHTRANAFVGRTVSVGDGHEPKLFDVWSAKAFAGIALERHLPDATMSRGIVIDLRRKMPHEKVARLRHADRSQFSKLAPKLARFAIDYYAQVRDARPALPDELGDRAQDNWEPLLAIAQCAGPVWIQRAMDAALAVSKVGKVSVSTGNELLADIQSVFEQSQAIKISTVDLIEGLTADDEWGWSTFNRGLPLTPRQLAKQLDPYGIKPKTIRFTDKHTPKGYDLAQFADAFARYLAPPQNLPQQRHEAPQAQGGTVPNDGLDRDATRAGGATQLPGRGGMADTIGRPPVGIEADLDSEY
jgi:putative DNA primase/helicase